MATSTAVTTARRARIRPLLGVALCVLAGSAVVLGLGVLRSDRATGRQAGFVAYRRVHHVGDVIGPNARVAAIDGSGRPTAVLSTDGKPPVVWAFEMQAPAELAPIRGKATHRFDTSLWRYPACPSALCPHLAARPGSPASVVAPPPPPLNVDACRALSPADLTPLLGREEMTQSSPMPGTCVWNTRHAGVQVEVGGPSWWEYLQQLPGLYRSAGSSPDELVDTARGLHLAVRFGPVTVVLLTYTNTGSSEWARIARKVATWAATA